MGILRLTAITLPDYMYILLSYGQIIAGHARSLGLIVVTDNLREFERVPGLRFVD